jgi:D-sedoheptulose 7-phosphate isomerase
MVCKLEFKDYVKNSISNLEAIHNDQFVEIFNSAAKLLLSAIEDGKSILVCGNGGSHSDAQHFAGELVNFFTRSHRALRVITLGTNSAVTSAWSNDHSFDEQLAREVEAYGEPGSVLLGITTSGKSKNVNQAFVKASSIGMKTIALASSKAIGNLSKEIDVVIPVPVDETHKIQECHMVIYQALCIFIENSLSKKFLY